MTTSPLPPRLTEGYRAFLAGRLRSEQDRYRELAETGQSPQIMVIGCCDSRVSPEVIFDAKPGELFVARNVANLVPPYNPDGRAHGVSAALEFAVQALRIRHIVVLGHARCGGIRAAVEDSAPLSPGDFIGAWMAIIAPAMKELGERKPDETVDAYATRLEKAALLHSVRNLLTFPCVSILAERNKLTLHAAYFGVADGKLTVHDQATNEFVTIATEDYAKTFAQPRF